LWKIGTQNEIPMKWFLTIACYLVSIPFFFFASIGLAPLSKGIIDPRLLIFLGVGILAIGMIVLGNRIRVKKEGSHLFKPSELYVAAALLFIMAAVSLIGFGDSTDAGRGSIALVALAIFAILQGKNQNKEKPQPGGTGQSH
jgi:O-antigen/teichoic acid export membrane protein